MTPRVPIRVAAAVISRGDEYLLSKRPEGSHLSGYWEFPGGKLEPGERPDDALVRELREELGIDVEARSEIEVLTHDYPERTVELTFIEAKIVRGTPRPVEVADVGWFRPDEMPALPVLPADLPFVAILATRVRRGDASRGEDAHA